ncbi:MAG: sigma-70 family RNA polymerase sigma factor [bacterium]|nr:sigma-70 family RNA polymerase sigma factor [bacterium]
MNSALSKYRKAAATDRRDQLVLEHMPLVRHIIGRRFAALPEHVDRENLESAGLVALVQAATQFDPAKAKSFSTYAYRRIQGAIVDELRRNSPLPQEVLSRLKAISAAKRSLNAPATVELLAEKTGFSVAEVENCLAAARFASPEDWSDSAAETHASQEQASSPLVELSRQEQKESVMQAIKSLPRKQRLVITLYYLEGLRLKEIGIVLNHSESYTSKLLARAELALREAVRSQDDSDLL